MWNALLDKARLRRRDSSQPRMFSKAAVTPNETGVGCLDNVYVLRIDTGTAGRETKPIHVHRTRPQSQEMSPSGVVYAAGQSPPAESFKDFLVQALTSKQGVFEIVSRAAHVGSERSTRKSVIDLLRAEIAKPRSSNTALTFGNRYVFQDLKQVAGKGYANDENDFLRCELTVIDRESDTEITVPLTQAGLKFTNKLLRPEEIRRANALLEAHQVAVESQGQSDPTDLPAVQVILSRAGVGRNATLISYQKFARLIENGLVTEATLDAMLEEEIDAGRMRRGPGYVHSMEQLASLRIALLEKMADVALTTASDITNSSRLSKTSGRIQQGFRSALGIFSSRQKAENRALSRSILTNVLQLQDNAIRNEDKASTTEVDNQILPNIAPESCVGPTKTLDYRQMEQASDTFPKITGETAFAIKSDEVMIQDGLSNPVKRARYTNEDIDMVRADLLLSAAGLGINFQRKLAAEDGGSWWRAAFTSVLLEQATSSPNNTIFASDRIAQRIRDLGPDFNEDATILERMMLQLINKSGDVESADGRGKGIRGFMTKLDPHRDGKDGVFVRSIFMLESSHLKSVGEDDADLDRPGEAALKRIAHAMMLKAGFSLATVDELFNKDSKKEGSSTHIVALMNQLGAREGIIFTRPRVQPDPSPSGDSIIDFEAITLDVYEMKYPLGPLRNPDRGEEQGDEVEKFIYAQANKPVIVAENGHFSILINSQEARGGAYVR